MRNKLATIFVSIFILSSINLQAIDYSKECENMDSPLFQYINKEDRAPYCELLNFGAKGSCEAEHPEVKKFFEKLKRSLRVQYPTGEYVEMDSSFLDKEINCSNTEGSYQCTVKVFGLNDVPKSEGFPMSLTRLSKCLTGTNPKAIREGSRDGSSHIYQQNVPNPPNEGGQEVDL